MERLGLKEDPKVLTMEELRSFKGLGGLSNEQAEDAIRTIEKLAILIYKICSRQNKKCK